MARKIVRPVTGEAAPALGAQRTLKGSNDMCLARGRLAWPEREQLRDLGTAARELGS